MEGSSLRVLIMFSLRISISVVGIEFDLGAWVSDSVFHQELMKHVAVPHWFATIEASCAIASDITALYYSLLSRSTLLTARFHYLRSPVSSVSSPSFHLPATRIPFDFTDHRLQQSCWSTPTPPELLVFMAFLLQSLPKYDS